MPETDRTLMRSAARDARAEVKDALARRKVVLARRSRAISARGLVAPPTARSAMRTRATSTRAASILAAGAADSVGHLIAEGDSWFDYPGDDILSLLADEHGYDVRSVAHAGDRVESMAYGPGQLDRFLRTLESLLRDGHAPAAILLSGGGNDIAGEELAALLDHHDSPRRGLNESIVTGVIDERLLAAYVRLVTKVTEACRAYLGTTVPLIVHGYDYPVPDGRGFGILHGWGLFPGPWLLPSFVAKGYEDAEERQAIMVALIDRFNAMVQRLAAAPEHAHVHYVNLRGLLQHDSYKRWWANELHPTPRGFALVAQAFAEAIGSPTPAGVKGHSVKGRSVKGRSAKGRAATA